MSAKIFQKIVTVGAALIVGAGCIGVPVHISNPPLARMDLQKGREITASASGFQLLLFIPININTRQARAYKKLQDQAGNDIVADVKMRESWEYAFVGTIYRTTFTAMAYPDKTRPLVAPVVLQTTLTQKLDELKQLRQDGKLSDAEYERLRTQVLSGP